MPGNALSMSTFVGEPLSATGAGGLDDTGCAVAGGFSCGLVEDPNEGNLMPHKEAPIRAKAATAIVTPVHSLLARKEAPCFFTSFFLQ